MLRNLLLGFFFFFVSFSFSQTLVSTRTAQLIDGPAYTLSGNAILERYSDGSLKLSLSSSYLTQSGPDVQIFLTNSLTSTVGGLFAADVGTGPGGISHFMGAISFNLPAGTMIGAYSNVVFQCVQFNALWGNGTFGPEVMVPPPPMCSTSTISGPNGISTFNICPIDGMPDLISFSNSLNTNGGPNYSYIITDDLDQIITIMNSSSFDFEGGPVSVTRRVYGISRVGALSFSVGSSITSISAVGCAIVTSNYLSVISDACPPPPACLNTTVMSQNGTSSISVCPTDGLADSVVFDNDLSLQVDSSYIYVLTNDLDAIIEVLPANSFDFEGSPVSITRRVYGVSVSGILSYTLGANINTITATDCAFVSSNFISVVTDGCAVVANCMSSTISGPNGSNSTNICPSDGTADVIGFTNSLGTMAGMEYVYLITDEMDEIIQVLTTDSNDFEGISESVERRVYGASIDGVLSATIGNSITTLTASNCAIVSNNFFSVITDDCVSTTSINEKSLLKTSLVVFPNPANSHFSFDTEKGNVRVFNSMGKLVFSSEKTETIDASNLASGVYMILTNEGSARVSVIK